MAWVKIDDNFMDSPEVEAIGGDAALLFIGGLCFCNRHLTDGFIPATRVPRLSDRKKPFLLAEKLVEAGMWDNAEDGYRVHNYLKWQRSAEQIEADREATRIRMERMRARQRDAKRDGVSDAPSDGERSPFVREQEPKRTQENPSSSSAEVDELVRPAHGCDEELLVTEAKRRLTARKGPPVANEEAWLARTVAQLVVEEWKPERHPVLVKASRPECDCTGGIILDDTGAAHRCPKCNPAPRRETIPPSEDNGTDST